MGIPKKSSNLSYQFASYVKTKNGWKSLEQPSSIYKKEKFINSYKIHYFNNKKDNITDKYDTQFSYIKSKDGLPIKQDINIEDFPVPLKKENNKRT